MDIAPHPNITKPTVGRIVHYHPHIRVGQAAPARAALVTAIHPNGTIDLCVFMPTGLSFEEGIAPGGPRAAEPVPGCWTWPPR